MKQLIIFIALLVVTLPQFGFAEEEVIWETEKIPYLHGVLVAPQGEIFYNLRGKDLQIRRVDDGVVIDSIIMENIPNYLYKMSITDDGRYMAFSGDNPYVIIYDLQERKEVKRITTIAYEREEYGNNVVYEATRWISSSISPDGTKFTGIATARNGEMTNFVVIDIATEKVLYEQRRIIYDHFNPDEPYYKWHSAEYSPDGNYIVSQLEFRTGSDSVYIYDANTFEVYDVVLNSFGEIVLNKYENLLATSRGKELILYNLDSKESKNIYFESQLRNIIFPMNENKIVLRIGTSTAVIYDYNLEKIANTISYRGLPKSSAKDNNLIYFGMDYNLALIKPDWDTINAINNLEKSNKSISPNPTTGLLNITLTNEVASFFRYEIISDSAQIIKTEDIGFLDNRNSQITINISTVVVGHYILKVFSNQEEFIFNVIKEG